MMRASSPALHVTTAIGAYARVQFLRAASHTVGAHAVPADATDDSDTDNDDDQVVNGSSQPQSLGPVSSPPSQDMCQVCLIAQRDARLAFVPSCVAQLEQQARGCPICRSEITMVMHLY